MVSPQSHIAVAAFPYGTHSAPLLSLTTALASLASSSHFSFLSTSRSLASLPQPCLANISFVPISDGITDPSVPANIEEQIGLFLKSFQESLREGLKEAEVEVGCKVSCVMSDAFLWMAGDAASKIGVKWVPVWTGGPQALSAHLHTDLIRKIVGVGDEAIKSYGDKKINFVPGLSNHLASDLQHGIIGGDLNSPISTMVYQMAHRLLNSDAIVLNMIQGLDPTVESYFTQKFTNYLPVGPFHLLNSPEIEQASDPYGCISWLDQYERATVVYISLGTIVTIPPSELTSLANGLEASEEGVVKALEVVLKGEEGRKMRDKARELKDMANTALTKHGSTQNNLKRLMEIVCGC
ncbi:anthocyanidin 3-O-glucosyltransferase 7-like protein [Carex littledalei]|uniref:Anthocyanidin 3-O-glucosyltransferase 7-like protein n=1 Tax=Carex littledalei TaxID=544730 RepID=A0A833RTN4_9POAL|nr:anthocyanidin 3-O-glucosyltransferase 7-like protein [Carex littledalei]